MIYFASPFFATFANLFKPFPFLAALLSRGRFVHHLFCHMFQASQQHRGLPGHRVRGVSVVRGRFVPLRRRRVRGRHQRGQGHRQGRAGAVQISVLQQDDEPQVGPSRGLRGALRCRSGGPRRRADHDAPVSSSLGFPIERSEEKTLQCRSRPISSSFAETSRVADSPST